MGEFYLQNHLFTFSKTQNNEKHEQNPKLDKLNPWHRFLNRDRDLPITQSRCINQHRLQSLLRKRKRHIAIAIANWPFLSANADKLTWPRCCSQHFVIAVSSSRPRRIKLRLPSSFYAIAAHASLLRFTSLTLEIKNSKMAQNDPKNTRVPKDLVQPY